MRSIRIRGARDNNLQCLDLDLPLNQLTVFCGVSGSGKSSLAFDTLHREGQRRYLEALLLQKGGMRRPDVLSIENLPPTVALDQRERSPGAHQTVAGLAALAVPLAVLFARVGVLHCPTCGRVIEPRSSGQIADELLTLPEGTRLTLEAPVRVDGDGAGVLDEIRLAGFSRIRLNGRIERLESVRHLDGPLRVVIDRVKVSAAKRDRIAEAVRLAGQIGDGVVIAVHEEEEQLFVDRPVCPDDGTMLPPLTPSRFRLQLGALDPAAACVEVAGTTLDALRGVPIADLMSKLGAPTDSVTETLLGALSHRVEILVSLRLQHLAVGAAASEVSRGEALRLRLACQLSSQVSGVLYVLDEPTAGLDVEAASAVVGLLRRTIEAGNTVLAVGHNPVLVRAADHLVEFGPGAGVLGGQLLYQGAVDGLIGTPTAAVLKGSLVPTSRGRTPTLLLAGFFIASPGVNVLHGVSGSGKTQALLRAAEAAPAHFDRIVRAGAGGIARVQRSSVATLSGVWTQLRDLLCQTREARVRGFSSTTFSLNAKGGRCVTCHGLGVVRTVLDPLPDVWDLCPECLGRRFQPEVLTVRWKGHNAQELLELEVHTAYNVLAGIPRLERALRSLRDVGLGHLQLGRAAPTLSGGEMRRLKLARELGRLSTGGLVLADDPSLGLHPVDTLVLMQTFERLAESGCTLFLATHDSYVVASADVSIAL